MDRKRVEEKIGRWQCGRLHVIDPLAQWPPGPVDWQRWPDLQVWREPDRERVATNHPSLLHLAVPPASIPNRAEWPPPASCNSARRHSQQEVARKMQKLMATFGFA